jgi:hypothetical protein
VLGQSAANEPTGVLCQLKVKVLMIAELEVKKRFQIVYTVDYREDVFAEDVGVTSRKSSHRE